MNLGTPILFNMKPIVLIKIKYLIGFYFLLFSIVACKRQEKPIEKEKSISIKSTPLQSLSIEELNGIIKKMLLSNKNLSKQIENLTQSDIKICLWYSQNECSTCTDSALADWYTIAKQFNNKNMVIIIAPELNERERKLLSLRYDNYFSIISGTQAIWGNFSSLLKNINSVFFTVHNNLEIENTYVLKIGNEQNNKIYYKKVLPLIVGH